MTLLEIMIVVVIIGVLAAVSVGAYMRYLRKARASEVVAMFAELKSREEAYHAEFGSYLSTGSSETDFWPWPLNGDNLTDISGGLPTAWQSLRVQTGKNGLYCGYSVTAGSANDNTGMGTLGNQVFGGTTPVNDWFYVTAECDFDNDTEVNSVYAQRGDRTDLYRENDGR